MKRNLALLAGVAAGAVAAIALRRRSSGVAYPLPTPEEPGAAEPEEPGAADPRAEDLRRKLAEARESAADEDDFEAAGMGPETLVEDETDVEETRRRVHDAARAAADEMRRAGETGPP